jgi:uncharacterized Tic20 family protein
MTQPPAAPGPFDKPQDPNQPPPTSGGGYAPPPASGGGYSPPPASGGGYTPPPASGGGYTQPPPQPGYADPSQGYGQQGYQQPGYQQPGSVYGAPPPGVASDEDKMWLMVAHFGGTAGVVIGGGILGWVGPLIAYLSRGPQSPTVRAHAVSALNHQITWAGVFLLVSILGFCGSFILVGVLLFFLLPFVALVPIICSIIAGAKATNGEFWKYPASISIVK